MGAFFHDSVVKLALEFMDMGTLGSLRKMAIAKDGHKMKEKKPIMSEAVAAKVIQQVLCGLAYLNSCMK